MRSRGVAKIPVDLTPKIDKLNTSNLKCFVYSWREVRYKNLCYVMSRNITSGYNMKDDKSIKVVSFV
jgi:hypothetical protein